MMMRMLHLGGMNIVADLESLEEKPGHHNKYGTFEVANYDWLVDNPNKIAGHCVKIVTQYITYLEHLHVKAQLPMKVIFMLRSLTAIHASLKKQEVIWDPPPIESIALGRKVVDHHKIPTLYVEFSECIKYPVATSQKVIDFIGRDLDIEKMVSAIDPDENHFGG
jgi:hypothetical protein